VRGVGYRLLLRGRRRAFSRVTQAEKKAKIKKNERKRKKKKKMGRKDAPVAPSFRDK
jgi:hypothetical protein